MAEAIIDQIVENDYEEFTNWSNRGRNGFSYRICSGVRDLLRIISGNEIVLFLKQLLTKHEIFKLANSLTEVYFIFL